MLTVCFRRLPDLKWRYSLPFIVFWTSGIPEGSSGSTFGLPEGSSGSASGLPKIDKFTICRHSSQTSDDCNSVIAYDRKTLRPSLETARSALFIEIKRSLLVQSNLKRLMREVVALYKIEISSFCMKQRFKDADYICVAKNTSTHTNFKVFTVVIFLYSFLCLRGGKAPPCTPAKKMS